MLGIEPKPMDSKSNELPFILQSIIPLSFQVRIELTSLG